MANSYSWDIPELECYPDYEGKNNVVYCIHWRRTATDGAGHLAEVYGSQPITVDITDGFVPVENLTKAVVEGWLETSLGEERINELTAILDNTLAEQVSPKMVSVTPAWG